MILTPLRDWMSSRSLRYMWLSAKREGFISVVPEEKYLWF
jgi:hypothetical protein